MRMQLEGVSRGRRIALVLCRARLSLCLKDGGRVDGSEAPEGCGMYMSFGGGAQKLRKVTFFFHIFILVSPSQKSKRKA